MKSLYITSVERYSGKTAVCLALGKQFQEDGHSVGYLKPLSLQPWRKAGQITDEDAAFVKGILGLDVDPAELSPVVVTPELLRVHLSGQGETGLMPKVKAASEKAAAGKDLLLLEGGGSLREGYVMGLPSPEVARTLGSQVLTVVKFRDEVRLMDDTLAASFRLGDAMAGIIINRVPADDAKFVEDYARPFIEKQGVAVFGVLPEVRGLAALTVEEINSVLEAQVLTKEAPMDGVVENLTVGAMTAEAALRRFRKQRNKAVITGGDRTDIQLAALETSTSCLVLTGNLEPRGLIIKQANELGVPVLLVRQNTMETIEAIDTIFGKTRMGHSAKLKMFQDLLAKNLDWKRLYEKLGL
ncbi:MAG: phosphotransacetylase family protein [Anaerolineales bacterium]|nr:phosphotransacetylase family protein [Anaerolineales bacterium]